MRGVAKLENMHCWGKSSRWDTVDIDRYQTARVEIPPVQSFCVWITGQKKLVTWSSKSSSLMEPSTKSSGALKIIKLERSFHAGVLPNTNSGRSLSSLPFLENSPERTAIEIVPVIKILSYPLLLKSLDLQVERLIILLPKPYTDPVVVGIKKTHFN